MLPTRLARPVALAALLSVTAGGCGYRLIRPDEIQVPSYEPREVVVPAECDDMIRAAAADGVARLTDAQARTVTFCQQQQIIRAQEEEAAARKLEAHAEAASFALRVTTVVIGATIAVLTWVF